VRLRRSCDQERLSQFTVGAIVLIVGILGYGVVVGELKAQAPSDRSE
jgi:hypothetical protein